MATELDRWYAANPHPLDAGIRRIAEIILTADPRMTAYVKYGNLNFGHVGDMASFVQIKNKKLLNLMFHRGAKLGSSPSFTGSGQSARFIAFASAADVEKRAEELRRLVAAWVDLMAAEGAATPKTKAKATAKPAAKNARKPVAKKAKKPAKKR
jgi:hypothetical protein